MTYDNLVLIILRVSGCWFFYFMLSYTTQSERKQEERMKQSLSDEFILIQKPGQNLLWSKRNLVIG